MSAETDIKKREFQKELGQILRKYGACIAWDYDDCSDLHGVYNQALTIDAGDWSIRVEGQYLDAQSLGAK